MMHPSSNINTSNNLMYDPSRVLEDNCYYYYSSPSFFPSSPSLYPGFLHEDGYNNNNKVQNDFFQDFLENHHEMIQQKQQNSLENSTNNDNNNNNNNNNKSKRVCVDEKIKINSPKKKISKKDRHTKIETAQGPRDRRMRLSLNIARKFFDLQDMLGFDKASKTVEWLLTKSISAISELSRNLEFQQVGANSSISSTSEIVVDDLLSSCTNGNLEKGIIMPNNNKNCEAIKKGNKKVARTIRPLAKESREKARERARERTMEKRTNLLKRREVAGGIKVGGNNGNSLVDDGCWMIPSTNKFLNLQQNGGINHGLTIPELEHLSGNFGEACIW